MKHRTMGRVVAVEDDTAWCTFPILGAGVLLRLDPDLLGGKAAPGFRFFCKIEDPRLDETPRYAAFEDMGFSDFELEHDQRVPTLVEILARQAR